MKARSLLIGAVLSIGLLAPTAAFSAPDVTDSVIFTEPDFGAFTGVKVVEIYAEGNPDDPFPGDGKFTYIYTVMNDTTSLLPVIGLQIQIIPGCEPATIGFFTGTGVDPDPPGGAVAGAEVEWNFTTTSIAPGASSSKLYLTSQCGPSLVPDLIFSVDAEGAFFANGLCLGPAVLPMVETPGEAMPCTIGFWKNRADGKQGVLQFFPGADFNAVVTAAVALSGGVFTDEADLLANLQSQGKRSTLERAKQQLAAFVLNLAAGDLFPDNQKCKLFEGNNITTNACGNGIKVGAALTLVIADVGSGDSQLENAALECSDDVNNGIGVTN